MVDTSDEWIVTRTGIRERRIVAEGETTSDLAAAPARWRMERAASPPTRSTCSSSAPRAPTTSSRPPPASTQAKLGLTCPAFDVMAACTSFIYALQVGDRGHRVRPRATPCSSSAPRRSRASSTSPTARRACCSATAPARSCCSAADEPGVDGDRLGADGTGADLLEDPGGRLGARRCTDERIDAHEQYLKMNGNEVFKFAVRVIPQGHAARRSTRPGTPSTTCAWLVPHQANKRIIDTIEERLGIADERVYCNVANTGNTSAASIPLALDDLYTSGRLHARRPARARRIRRGPHLGRRDRPLDHDRTGQGRT